MDREEKIDYSLVICAYNPDERILGRCLEAVLQLDITGITTEVLLIDNNSSTPLNTVPYILAYREKIPRMQIVPEPRQGQTYARMTAAEQSQGGHVVFFDADNEPAPPYLQELHRLIQQYPHVAAWGPGHVKVDFIDGVPPDIAYIAPAAFQYREEQAVSFGSEKEWQPCYPYGTGLCIKTPLLKQYMQLVQEGHFTLTGRKGKKLSSGEDTQMIMLCIRDGYAAGVAPALSLTHIISGNRANRKYLNRLFYGTAVCYETCLLQVFPERREALERKAISRAKFVRRAVKKLVKAKWARGSQPIFDYIGFLAMNTGVYTALQKPVPRLVGLILKYLDVE
jgi:glycosyltransferase involved in cell wall biosynthesis